jgi:hypothetical protein
VASKYALSGFAEICRWFPQKREPSVDDEYPENNLKLRQEQRKFFRFPVEGEAILFLPESGGSLRCGMIDLGLEGCRLRREEEIPVRVGSEVAVAFRLAGENFRFAGLLQWTARNRVLGIHFEKMSAARRQELSELLGGLREELEARAMEAQAAKEKAAAEPVADEADSEKNPQAAENSSTEPAPAPESRSKQDRREHARHTVEGTARVRFLSLHSQIVGKILDVSMGGCRIRSLDVIPVGAFRRVEIEFLVNGVPLLLPGVTQALHDRHTVGIRFVEVTDRKKDQLRAVIDEIEQGVAS